MEFLQTHFGHISHFIMSLFDPSFWTNLLQVYKYWIVIGGALVEGEMVLILAGAAAQQGYMSIYFVIAMAFVGAVIHDHLLFFLGRYWGKKIFSRFPTWQGRVDKITIMINRYDHLFIMGFRFIYGIRTITPLILGTTRISVWRYSALVTLSALIWAVIISYLGYSFFMILDKLLQDFDLYKKYLTLGIIVFVALVSLFFTYRNYLIRRRRSQKKK